MFKRLVEKYGNQSAVAEAFGVSATAVSKWKSGQTFPNRRILQEIADELGVSVGEVYENWMSEEDENDKP